MNPTLAQLAQQAGITVNAESEKFAELIVQECDRLNQTQSFELAGVVADIEQGNGFDSVCLATVKRVENYLADSTLKQHFGVKE